MKYVLTVGDSFTISGRGLVATGTIECDAEPVLGPCSITLPDGATIEDEVIGWDGFAIARWYKHPCGAMLKNTKSIAAGAVIRGTCKG